MAQSLQSDLEIQKTALSSLIQRIDVTQIGTVGVEFYLMISVIPRTQVRMIESKRHIRDQLNGDKNCA